MKLLAVDSESGVTIKTYTVEKDGQTYHYKDYIEYGKILDSELRTIDGEAVEDPALFEEIQTFVDENGGDFED